MTLRIYFIRIREISGIKPRCLEAYYDVTWFKKTFLAIQFHDRRHNWPSYIHVRLSLIPSICGISTVTIPYSKRLNFAQTLLYHLIMSSGGGFIVLKKLLSNFVKDALLFQINQFHEQKYFKELSYIYYDKCF